MQTQKRGCPEDWEERGHPAHGPCQAQPTSSYRGKKRSAGCSRLGRGPGPNHGVDEEVPHTAAPELSSAISMYSDKGKAMHTDTC